MIVVGFTGKRGCGKDTASGYLEDKHGFVMLDFTRDVLAPILVKQGKPVTRENLIDTGMEGRRKNHNGIWADKLSEIIKQGKGKNFVISGIRFREEVAVFRKNFPGLFKLVAIMCDERTRYERVKRRSTKGEAGISFEKFRETEKRPTERVIAETMKTADFSIDNNDGLDDLYSELESLMEVLKR